MNHTSRRHVRLRVLSLGLLLLAAGLVGASSVQAPQPTPSLAQSWPAEFDGCTSIMVGRLASADGSVMTAHTCDGNYRQWVTMVPHGKYPEGAKNKIYSGLMHTETPVEMRGVKQTGEIPQVAETYAFLNTAYPSMNEAGLAIGETTIGGRRELYNPEGQLMIEEIERIVLERCKTAREAIKLAGELIKTYGYGDAGECITIADAKEVWHFEVMGEGPLQKGGVWAAVRIPDDHVGISANIPRISEIDLKNPDRYMASENVFKVAEDMGWYDPKKGEPFKFWKAYSGGRPYSIRDFYVLSTLAPSLGLKMDMAELPFTVKPEKKLTISDVLKYYRETYAGTEWDPVKNLMVPRRPQMRRPGSEPAQPAAPAQAPEMVKSPLAQPFISGDLTQLLNTLKPGTVSPTRAIAISGCAYATVLQCRPNMPPGHRHGLLVRLRQPRPERPHPDLCRRHDAAPELRHLRPVALPDGLGGLDLPPDQPPGHGQVGRGREDHDGQPGRLREEGPAGDAAGGEDLPGASGLHGAREAALHPGRVPDQVLQRLRPCRHEQVHRAGRPVHVPAPRRPVSRAADRRDRSRLPPPGDGAGLFLIRLPR